jgi:hypothetical protein
MKRIPIVGLTLLVALIGGLTSTVVVAQRDEYNEGREAREKGDWTSVVKLMTEAIRKEGSEQRGLTVRDYLPYFFLGEAFYKQGLCKDALNAWDASSSQGKVTGHNEYRKVLQGGSSECQKRGYLLKPELGPTGQQTETVIAQASSANADLKAYLAKHRDLSNPFLQRRQITAEDEVALARKKWREGQSTRLKKDFDDAQQKAADARDEFVLIQRGFEALDNARSNNDLSGRLGSPGAVTIGAPPVELPVDALNNARTNLSRVESDITKAQRGLATLTPEAAAALGKEIDNTRRSFRAARAALLDAQNPPNIEKFRAAELLISALRGKTRRLAVGAPGALDFPDGLMTGADAFFSGNYELAVSTLTDEIASSTGQTLKPALYAIRAAALLALYDRGGRTDGPRMAGATDDVKLCKALDSNFRPDPTAFSPRFVKFFDNVP